MKISELLINNDLCLKITSYTASSYRATLYLENEQVDLVRGCCVGSLYGTGNTINEAIKDLIDEIETTHKIKVNKNTLEDAYYINIDNLHQ